VPTGDRASTAGGRRAVEARVGRGDGAATDLAEGHAASPSTVERALRRRGLLLPRGYRADRRLLGQGAPPGVPRPAHGPQQGFGRPTSPSWKPSTADLENLRGHRLRHRALPGGHGHTNQQRRRRTLACLDIAVTEETRLNRHGRPSQRPRRGGCAETRWRDSRPGPGAHSRRVRQRPCFRSEAFAQAFTGHDPLPRHVRTRVRSPQTNGVIERIFGTLAGAGGRCHERNGHAEVERPGDFAPPVELRQLAPVALALGSGAARATG
jgi:putative transposase